MVQQRMKSPAVVLAAVVVCAAAACGDESDNGGATTSAGASTSGSGGAAGGVSSTGGATTSSSTGGGGAAGAGGSASSAVYHEVGGLVAVEAEHFDTNDDLGTPRAWHLSSTTVDPAVTPDPDEIHADSASGSAYMEGLPDTRVTDSDPIQEGVSIYNNVGTGPTLSYRVYFDDPGTYYVWVRAYSTGTEDNGIHAGIDATWPATGERVQFCSGKNQWTWSSAQRDSGSPPSSCGVPNTITLDVPTAGEHVIAFSMREDGFEFDKWIMTTDAGYVPSGEGPPEVEYTGN